MSEAKPAKKTTTVKAAAAPKAAEHAGHAKDTSAVVMIKGKQLSTRGRSHTGIVISNKMHKTVTVEWERRRYVPKYQRYEKRRTKVKAHDETGAKIGDTVEIIETRPISKTKNFLVKRIVKQA